MDACAQPHLTEGILGGGAHVGARMLQQPKLGIEAHQHHIQRRNVDGNAAALGNIAALLCKFPRGKPLQRRTLQRAGAGMGQNAADGLQQGGFSAAICAENADQLPGLGGEGYVMHNVASGITGG